MEGGEAPDGPRPRTSWSRFWWLLIVLLAVNWIISSLLLAPNPRETVSYTFFLQQVSARNVAQVTSTGEMIQGDFKKAVSYTPQGGKAEEVERFTTQRPTFAEDNLFQQLQSTGVPVNAKPPDAGPSVLVQLLLGFGPTLLLVWLLFSFGRRLTSGAGNPLGAFGRSRATLYRPEAGPRTTFADVAGIDEVKGEVSEIVDYLRNPEKYSRLGAQIPRGVLLSGPPGSGKTLLARAVAGEADVPFFSISASEFIEAIVGVGASRVRDLFNQAKQAAPAIIFIDELDAIGRSRGGGASFGGNDEREQTLNQILTEMDGFDPAIGVIVLAATNRPEILDPALLRPGRFDRRVNVQPPDTVGRRKILEVHTRSVPLDDSVDLDSIAATTVGMVGADLANLVNEAALTAARLGHDTVRQEDFTNALERIILGSERKIMMTEKDRERTAYHESGHALVGMLTPGADPVRKVSIIPRGPALGVTLSAPEADRFSYDQQYLLGRIKVALAGRVSEKLIYGEITTGAESDIEQLTQIARQMVGRWGMSDAVGPIAVIPRDGQGPLLPGASEVSAETHRVIDEEVRRLVDECENDVRALLSENRPRLDALVAALLEKETLDQDEAYLVAGVTRPAPMLPDEHLETVSRDKPSQ